ncbi:MAG: AEC family transporter [Ruminococcaceae bacterium]|nr:AEC family transporter [Oscillospiraceae bacterium]
MSHLVFSTNAVFPLILMAVAGYLCKRLGLCSKELAAGMNRLVFRVFLPVMLFLNIYKIEKPTSIDLTYVWYTLGITGILFLISIPVTSLITKEDGQRGVLIQATFRSNFALVGIPLATALFGSDGSMIATLLSAFLIPLYNILAVICLTVFSKKEDKHIDFSKLLMGIVKNPLIQAIALGGVALLVRAIFVRCDLSFRLSDVTFLYKTLNSLSSIATPLSLVVLGAQFEFSAIASLKKQLLFGVATRAVIVPVVGLGIAYLLGCFNGAHFAAFVAAFATPIAVSSVPMAQEMGADSALAGQLVVWTTLLSAVTIFLSATILKAAGIF